MDEFITDPDIQKEIPATCVAQIGAFACAMLLADEEPLSRNEPIIRMLANFQAINPMCVTAFACAFGAGLPPALREAHLADMRGAFTGKPVQYDNGEATFAEYQLGFKLGVDPYHEVAAKVAPENWKTCVPRLMAALNIVGDRRPENAPVLARLVGLGVLQRNATGGYSYSRSGLEALARSDHKGDDGKSKGAAPVLSHAAFH